MDGLSVGDADLTVYVHPSKSNKIKKAILHELSSVLFTYDEKLDGVILAYEVHIQSKTAKILSGLIPYFGVKVKASLLLFSPKPDMLLEGKVAKLGRDFISVIVLGFCSGLIMLKDIREDFHYKIKNDVGAFVSKSHKRHAIKVGTMVRFLVKSIDEEILHIHGSLMPPHTGCIRWLSKHGVDDNSNIDRKLKRHRESENKKEMHDVDRSLDHSHTHKSRRRIE